MSYTKKFTIMENLMSIVRKLVDQNGNQKSGRKISGMKAVAQAHTTKEKGREKGKGKTKTPKEKVVKKDTGMKITDTITSQAIRTTRERVDGST